MKNFRKTIGVYFSKITTKYDLDMNLIEGLSHKEFSLKKSFSRPNSVTYHLYHIKH